jgi:hypothetical protein
MAATGEASLASLSWHPAGGPLPALPESDANYCGKTQSQSGVLHVSVDPSDGQGTKTDRLFHLAYEAARRLKAEAPRG